eukprot:scaffold3353_cov79-Cylindrotheca_fusiformis.AAC.1
MEGSRNYSKVIMLYRSDFRGSNDGSATITRCGWKKAAETIPRSWFGIDQLSEARMIVLLQQSPLTMSDKLRGSTHSIDEQWLDAD